MSVSISVLKIYTETEKGELLKKLTSSSAVSDTLEDTILKNTKGIKVYPVPRKDGRYCGYITKDGTRKFVYGKSVSDVKNKLRDLLSNGKKKQKEKPQQKVLRFEEYCKQWIELYKEPNLKPKSLAALHRALKKPMEAFSGVPINKITTDMLQSFLAAMPRSRSRDLCVVYLKNLFKRALILRYIKYNPCDLLEIKKCVANKRAALSEEEEKAFLEATKTSTHSLLFRFLLSTGLRIGEALALKKTDFDSGTVTVSKNVVFVNGKRILQTPKTNAGNRTVPVPKNIYDSILALPTEDVFPFSYNAISTAFKKLSAKIGFRVSAHILRHTYATHLEEAKVPIKIKQYLLGHSSVAMTEDVYTNIRENFLRKELSTFIVDFDDFM